MLLRTQNRPIGGFVNEVIIGNEKTPAYFHRLQVEKECLAFFVNKGILPTRAVSSPPRRRFQYSIISNHKRYIVPCRPNRIKNSGRVLAANRENGNEKRRCQSKNNWLAINPKDCCQLYRFPHCSWRRRSTSNCSSGRAAVPDTIPTLQHEIYYDSRQEGWLC